MSTPGEKNPGASELFSHTLGNAVKPGFTLARIPEGGAYQKPVTSSPKKCPRCNEEIPEDNDATGEGPVYWTESDEPYCGMECVVAQHRKWLKEKKARDEANLPPGGRGDGIDWEAVQRRL